MPIDGLPLHRLDRGSTVDRVMERLGQGRGGCLYTVNLQFLFLARRHPDFRELLMNGEMLVADGMPLVWASRLQRDPLPERVTGVDLVTDLAAACAANDRSMYLLGGHPGSAEATGAILRTRWPRLRICGIRCPRPGFDHDERALQEEAAALVDAAPDLVLLAFGAPRQEWLIHRWRTLLPAAWWLGIGGSFDLLSGRLPRAPRWMRRCGLEWAYRLGREPGRLARRYLLECGPVGFSLLARSAWRGIIGPARHADHGR